MSDRVFIELADKFYTDNDVEAELDTGDKVIAITVYAERCSSCDLSYESARILANWILENIPTGGKDAK